MKRIGLLSVALLLAGLAAPLFGQETEPQVESREIVQLKGDLYEVRSGDQCALLLVTPDGIVLADPLSTPTALWLRDQIATRFPNRDVRYVLHSYHHYTRAAGAAVFNDTAEIVAHGTFEGQLKAARAASPDRYRFAHSTDRAYVSRLKLTFGGTAVVLVNVPLRDAPDMTVIHFPRERVLFAVDPPGITNVPFSFGRYAPHEVFNWIHVVDALDFDMIVLGNGATVTRAEFTALATHLDAVRAIVASGYESGRTLAQIQSSAALDAHRTSPHSAALASQVADIYRTVQVTSAGISFGAIANYDRRDDAYCEAATACAGGGAVPGARIGVSLLPGNRIGLLGELTIGAQSWSARTSRTLDEETATRRSRAAILLRYGPRPTGAFSYALVAGVSVTAVDVQGENRVKGRLQPSGGVHAIATRNYESGVTVGIDFAQRLSRDVGLAVPIRVTRMAGRPDASADAAVDAQIGVDLTIRVFRRVHDR